MKIFDIIKYEGPHDVLVWKYPGEDFNTLSQLIVHESQEAVFFKDGKALDIFGPGRYTLHSQNIPIIRKLINLPFNGESPFHCEVYFINRAVAMDIDWETDKPMPIQDALYKIVLPISSTGRMGIRVIDSKKLLISLVGTEDVLDQDTVYDYFCGILESNIKDHIANQFSQKQISFLEIHSHLKDISNGIKVSLSSEFSAYGIELAHFNINDITPPANDTSYLALKKALAKKAEMAVIGYSYQQERAFDVLDTAAANEGSSSNIMGVGMGLGMGTHLGGVIGGMMGEGLSVVQTIPVTQKTTTCTACNMPISNDAKFCLGCGQKVEDISKVICPHCQFASPKGSKFCMQCGSKVEQLCSSCGANSVPNAKFCLICGNKLN